MKGLHEMEANKIVVEKEYSWRPRLDDGQTIRVRVLEKPYVVMGSARVEGSKFENNQPLFCRILLLSSNETRDVQVDELWPVLGSI